MSLMTQRKGKVQLHVYVYGMCPINRVLLLTYDTAEVQLSQTLVPVIWAKLGFN